MRADARPRRRPRRRWRMPVVGVGLLAGVFGFAALRPVGLDDGSPSTTVALATDAEPIAVCTRASSRTAPPSCSSSACPASPRRTTELVDRLADIGVGGVMLRDENITGEEQTEELVAGLRDRLGADLLVAVDDEGGRVSSMGELGQSVTSARRLGQAGEDAAEEAGAGARRAGGLRRHRLGVRAGRRPRRRAGVWRHRQPLLRRRPRRRRRRRPARSRGACGRPVVAVTVKHFPGHGGTGDPHRGDTIDNTTLASSSPSRTSCRSEALIDDGAETVMVGHVSYPQMWDDLPASLEPGRTPCCAPRGSMVSPSPMPWGWGRCTPRYGFDVAPGPGVGGRRRRGPRDPGRPGRDAARRRGGGRARGPPRRRPPRRGRQPRPRAARSVLRGHRLPRLAARRGRPGRGRSRGRDRPPAPSTASPGGSAGLDRAGRRSAADGRPRRTRARAR